MAINRIITEKELNYIETLYLYANLEDFLTYESTAYDWLIGEELNNGKLIWKEDLEDKYSHDKYSMMMDYLYDTMLHSAKYNGIAKGRAWYEFDNYSIGIMDYDTAKSANQYNVVIQYFQHHMFTLNKSLDGLDLPFDGTFDQYQIKRIDICKIFKSPINYTIGHNYLSAYRNPNGHSRHENTVYLGNRRNGNVFRMYSKTIELRETENYKKMELLSKYFGDIEDLYTFELELHRSQLKGTLGIEKLSDLSKVYEAYGNIVGKIRIYEDNDRNKKLIKANKRERIKGIFVTEFIDYERVKKKKYKPSKSYAMDRQEKTFSRYIESMGIKEEKEINKLRLEFGMNIISNDKQDVKIEFEDNVSTVQLNEMKEKHERLRVDIDSEEIEKIQFVDMRTWDIHCNLITQSAIAFRPIAERKPPCIIPSSSY